MHASFPQERMTYLQEESKVIYQSKDGKEEKAFDALEWLGACALRYPTRENRWFVIMATRVTSPAEGSKRKTGMGSYLILLNQKRIQRISEKLGKTSDYCYTSVLLWMLKNL